MSAIVNLLCHFVNIDSIAPVFSGVTKETLLLLKVQKKLGKKIVKASKNANPFFVFPEVLTLIN